MHVKIRYLHCGERTDKHRSNIKIQLFIIKKKKKGFHVKVIVSCP